MSVINGGNRREVINSSEKVIAEDITNSVNDETLKFQMEYLLYFMQNQIYKCQNSYKNIRKDTLIYL